MLPELLTLIVFAGGGGFFVFKKVQEKKKAQEAAKPDPDADYVDDDEDYGYDPELRYRDSYPRIRKKVVRCKTDSFSLVRLGICVKHDETTFREKQGQD